MKREHLLRAMAKLKAQVGEEKEVPLTRFDPKKAIKALEPEKHEESKKEKVNSEQTKAKTKATLSRMKELINGLQQPNPTRLPNSLPLRYEYQSHKNSN